MRIKGDKVTGAKPGDDAAFKAFHKRMTRFANLLATYLNKTPPRLGTRDPADLMTLGKLGFDIRRLGKREMQAFLQAHRHEHIYDEVIERFDCPILKWRDQLRRRARNAPRAAVAEYDSDLPVPTGG